MKLSIKVYKHIFENKYSSYSNIENFTRNIIIIIMLLYDHMICKQFLRKDQAFFNWNI